MDRITWNVLVAKATLLGLKMENYGPSGYNVRNDPLYTKESIFFSGTARECFIFMQGIEAERQRLRLCLTK